MMKPLKHRKLFFCFLILIHLGAFAQTRTKPISIDSATGKRENTVSDLGIGLVFPPDTFDIYSDSSLHIKYYHGIIACISEDCNNATDTICKKCRPLDYNPVYGIMDYVCLGKTATAYKILVNYSTIKYVPIKDNYEFENWDEYILESYDIGISDESREGEYVVLKKRPEDDADTIHTGYGYDNGDGLFHPIEVKGSWVKIKYESPIDSSAKRSHYQTGWIRWRRKNKLLLFIDLGD